MNELFIRSVTIDWKLHGESFVALAEDNLRENSLYIMDEPEAALSPQRQLALLAQIHECALSGAQFLIATHSPILLGLPDAQIFCFDEGRIHPCAYEDTESCRITEMFINNRRAVLNRLLAGDKEP